MDQRVRIQKLEAQVAALRSTCKEALPLSEQMEASSDFYGVTEALRSAIDDSAPIALAHDREVRAKERERCALAVAAAARRDKTITVEEAARAICTLGDEEKDDGRREVTFDELMETRRLNRVFALNEEKRRIRALGDDDAKE